jgi:predicted secreted protein
MLPSFDADLCHRNSLSLLWQVAITAVLPYEIISSGSNDVVIGTRLTFRVDSAPTVVSRNMDAIYNTLQSNDATLSLQSYLSDSNVRVYEIDQVPAMSPAPATQSTTTELVLTGL